MRLPEDSQEHCCLLRLQTAAVDDGIANCAVQFFNHYTNWLQNDLTTDTHMLIYKLAAPTTKFIDRQ